MSNRIIRTRFFKQSYQSWKQAGYFRALLKKIEVRYISLLEGHSQEIIHLHKSDEIQFIFDFNDVFGQGDFLLEYISELLKKEGFFLRQSNTYKNASETFGFELMERMVFHRSKWYWVPWITFKDTETLIFSLSVGHQNGRLSIKHQSQVKSPRFQNTLNAVAWLLEKHQNSISTNRCVK